MIDPYEQQNLFNADCREYKLILLPKTQLSSTFLTKISPSYVCNDAQCSVYVSQYYNLDSFTLVNYTDILFQKHRCSKTKLSTYHYFECCHFTCKIILIPFYYPINPYIKIKGGNNLLLHSVITRTSNNLTHQEMSILKSQKTICNIPVSFVNNCGFGKICLILVYSVQYIY